MSDQLCHRAVTHPKKGGKKTQPRGAKRIPLYIQKEKAKNRILFSPLSLKKGHEVSPFTLSPFSPSVRGGKENKKKKGELRFSLPRLIPPKEREEMEKGGIHCPDSNFSGEGEKKKLDAVLLPPKGEKGSNARYPLQRRVISRMKPSPAGKRKGTQADRRSQSRKGRGGGKRGQA